MRMLIARHEAGEHIGIRSVCSAHPSAVEAVLAFNCNSMRRVLIEATSNQVNQFGGYTGMTPADFREFAFAIAGKVGFARERIIPGGGHLGPNCWQQEDANAATEKSVELVKTYVRAGFSKIHLDVLMSCADDSIPLASETAAERAAVLCLAVENVAIDCQCEQLNYVISTEASVPGGEASAIQSIHITQVENVTNTLRMHQKASIARGLAEALTRVIAVVVQSGMEFDYSNITHYQVQEAQASAQWIEKTKVVYEAYSTDYQTQTVYRESVRDHFAILKVGPVLTFALHRAIFALAQIEQELIVSENRSRCLAVIKEVMLDEPQYWKKYYRTGFNDSLLDIRYSLSDHIRHYWPYSRTKNSVEMMMVNLEGVDIPLGMISRYFPKQFERIQSGELSAIPHQLITDKIYDVSRVYRYDCAEQGRYMTNLLVRSGISFADRSEVLTYIGNEILAKGVVHNAWPQTLVAREAESPTGVMFEQRAIAIPHCEAIHAKSSAIYLLRPTNGVRFWQADDDNNVVVSLVIALIMENLQQ